MLVIVAACFGFGYIMNPKNITEYDYKESELWEAPSYWKNFEKN